MRLHLFVRKILQLGRMSSSAKAGCTIYALCTGTINSKLSSLRHFAMVCSPKISWHYWENIAFLPWTGRTTNNKKAVDVGWREQCCSSVGFHRWVESLVNLLILLGPYVVALKNTRKVYLTGFLANPVLRQSEQGCLFTGAWVLTDLGMSILALCPACNTWSSWWDLRNSSGLKT